MSGAGEQGAGAGAAADGPRRPATLAEARAALMVTRPSPPALNGQLKVTTCSIAGVLPFCKSRAREVVWLS